VFAASIVACFYASIALFGYHATDPGFSRTGLGEVQNVAGPVGAYVADVLFQLMGWTAWAMLPLGFGLLWRLAGREVGGFWRVLSATAGVWIAACLLALAVPVDVDADFPAGGLLGLMSVDLLRGLIGPAGTWLLLLASLGAVLVGMFRVDLEALAARGVTRFETEAPRIGRVGWRAGRQAVSGVASAAQRVHGSALELLEREDLEDYLGDEDDIDSSPGFEDVSNHALEEPDVGVVPTPTVDPRERFSVFTPAPIPEELQVPEARTQAALPALAEVEWEPTGAVSSAPSRVDIPIHAPDVRDTVVRGSEVVSAPQGAMPAPTSGSTWDSGPNQLNTAQPAVPSSAGSAPASWADGLGPVPSDVRGTRWDAQADDIPPSGQSITPSVPHSAPSTSSAPVAAASPASIGSAVDVPASAAPAAEASSAMDEEPVVITPAPRTSTRERSVGGPGPELTPGNLESGGVSDTGVAVIDVERDSPFELPHLGLLDFHLRDVAKVDESGLRELGQVLEQKLADFGVKGEVKAIRPGPVITTFEYLPAPGVKISKIAGLSDDIAMALKALRVRIVAPIPGKGVVGIEIPNKSRLTVWIRDILAADAFRRGDFQLPMALGKSVEGKPVIGDLARMPHLLVGGTTGSGKSVGINAMLMTLLFARTPDELKLIMIDPKMLEFELYQDIPHLLHPVVTEPKLASAALKWACAEMDERYRLLARWKTRNIVNYNERVEAELKDWTPEKARRFAPKDWPRDVAPPQPEKLPYLVIVIDELADLMMAAAKDVEESIIRLAQKARACGIHLIVATQRPSVNVITGLIKANMPSRIAFQVRTKVDARTILDQNGAENLLGKGDLLYLPPGVSGLQRCHGPFVSDEEARKVTDFLREQGTANYDLDITGDDDEAGVGLSEDDYDELYDDAVAFICQQGKASTSMVQRRFKIGYNRAARIIEVMEMEGVVGPADGARPRKVLVPHHGE